MECFVFGSNLAGVHGAGAAAYARKHHGAILGQGIGLQGNSYGIPTKDSNIHTLPIQDITKYVNQFIEFANTHREMTFMVTRIGCGLAGYTDIQIAPLFKDAPDNCVLPNEWEQFINN